LNKKNIWLISQYTSPEKFGYHTKHHFLSIFFNKKYNIKIFSSTSSSYHSFGIQKSKSFHKKKIDNVDYTLLKNSFYKNTKINKILGSIEFSIRLLFHNPLLNKNKPKLIFITVPNSIISVSSILIAKLVRAKTVVEVRDIWPLAQQEYYGISRIHPYYIMYKFLEWFFHKYADMIVSPIPHYKLYLDESKIKYNNYSFIPQFTIVKKNQNIKNQKNSILTGVYSGNLNTFRPILEFIRAVEILNNRNVTCNFIFIGSGDKLLEAKKYVKNKKIENIIFKGALNKEKANLLIQKADFGLSLLYDTKLYNKYGLCSLKNFEYMAYNIPIFSVGSNETCSDLSKFFGGGFCIQTNSKEIAKSLENFLFNFDTNKKMALKSRAFLEEKRSVSFVGNKLFRLFDNLNNDA